MDDRLQALVDVDEATLNDRWNRLTAWIKRRFEKEAGIEAILFLIGIQERGRGYEPEMEKEAKQDLIMEGTHCAFEKLGLYQRVGMDEDERWVWQRTMPGTDGLSVAHQEKLLRLAILAYFDDVV